MIDAKYRLAGLLGRGPTGTVYEARHVQLSHACAVKVLHTEVSGDLPAVQRAFGDARAAAAIGHPGIADVFDTGQTADGAPYIVTELLEGGTLAVRLGGLRRLPASEAVELVAQALAAVGAAHRRDLVHGDLKPTNLYVVETPGERPSLRLLDFGARRLVSAADRDGFPAFGTPQFLSPEQVAGRTDIDHRSDLYSLGVLLFLCVTGRAPFENDDRHRLRALILTEPFPDPMNVEPSLHPGLAAVIRRASARHRDERYGSAEAMLHALAPYLGAESRSRMGLPAVPRIPTPARARRDAWVDAVAEEPSEETLDEVARPAAPARARSVAFGVAIASGPLALLAVIVALLVLLARDRQPGNRPPAAAPPVAAVPSPASPECQPAFAPTPGPAPFVVQPIAPPPAPPAPSPTVTVTLRGLPDGAIATVGDLTVENGTIAVPRGEAPLAVTVSAAGYEPFTTTLVPDADMVLALSLSRQAQPAPARPSSPRVTQASVHRPAENPFAGRPTEGPRPPPPPPPPPPPRDAGLQPNPFDAGPSGPAWPPEPQPGSPSGTGLQPNPFEPGPSAIGPSRPAGADDPQPLPSPFEPPPATR